MLQQNVKMSQKKCGKCEKTVYPTEELKCLDKVWHKACFKCQECNMTLSMRNYKGFDKWPYCGAHVPKAKATVVADTPESKRLAENSKLQSNVKYHADFEAAKGKFTSVTDDPESIRLKANNQIISNVSYHGVVEQKLEQEKKRSLVGGENEVPIVKNLVNDAAGPSAAAAPNGGDPARRHDGKHNGSVPAAGEARSSVSGAGSQPPYSAMSQAHALLDQRKHSSGSTGSSSGGHPSGDRKSVV